jgi:HAD domain in Swiss Army Knife RNA repair proteins
MTLFLDIDGVLVHANPSKKVEMDDDGFYRFSPTAVEALNLLLSNIKSEIILTTSHRFRYSLAEWKAKFLSRGIIIENISRIERATPFGESRKETILKCISEYNLLPEQILIIDDDKSLNGLPDNLKRRLILTDSYKGFCKADILFDTNFTN